MILGHAQVPKRDSLNSPPVSFLGMGSLGQCSSAKNTWKQSGLTPGRLSSKLVLELSDVLSQQN